MKYLFFFLLVANMASAQQLPASPVNLANELLAMVKQKQEVKQYVSALEQVSPEALNTALYSDDVKLAFWINIYNAFIQIKLKEDSNAYANRSKFFKSRTIIIAGQKLSFDDIEHGILRSGKVKWSLGYLNNPFLSKFIKSAQVHELDWRIHFALNCGAMSCPLVEFYDAKDIRKQLENSTNLFLMFESAYDSTTNEMKLPKLFRWFKGDFGGKKGIYKLLETREYIPVGSKPKLVYTEYDWSLAPAKFR